MAWKEWKITIKQERAFVLTALLIGICGWAIASFVQIDDYGVTLGQSGYGTQFAFVELYSIDFTGDTSQAVRTQAKGTEDAVVLTSWQTYTGTDPGSVTSAIASNGLTLTAAASTTGTLHVAVIGLPENSPTRSWQETVTSATQDVPFRVRGR